MISLYICVWDVLLEREWEGLGVSFPSFLSMVEARGLSFLLIY